MQCGITLTNRRTDQNVAFLMFKPERSAVHCLREKIDMESSSSCSFIEGCHTQPNKYKILRCLKLVTVSCKS